LGDDSDDRGRRLLSHAKEIEPSRGISNKDRRGIPAEQDHGAGACLFVKQQHRQAGVFVPRQNIEMEISKCKISK
jgi:hypothetical protein